MKYLVTTALALSLIAGGAAFAQEHHDERGGEHPGGGGGPHPGGGAPHGPPPGAQPHGPPPGAPRGGPAPGPQGGGPRPGPRVDQGRPGPAPAQNFDRGRAGPGPAPGFDRGRPGPGPAPGFDRGRPGAGGFRPRAGGFLDSRHFTFSQRFRGPAFYYPRGYGYQYFGFGAFLPPVYLAQNYSLYDYWTYGLPAPPPGYRWIRVGPDALLVRYGDGYVMDAAYGLFY